MAAQRFTGHHEASWRRSASQDITALLRTPRRSAQPGFGYTSRFSYSFSYSFSYKIFLEQLCFSIDSSVSSLL